MVKDEMILIETLKAIEPALKKYFAYDRAMLYKEIESMYLAIHPEGLYGVLNDDKYMIEVPNTLDELATSDNPFDYLRYAPREQKMIKAFDSLAYMTEYSIYFQLQEEDALLVFSGSTADKFLKKRFWIGPDTQNLGVLMEQLFYELKYKYTGYMIQVEALLQQCLVKVVRNYEGNRFSKQHFAPSNLIDGKTLIIERAFLYHYETITLENLAKTLGLSVRQTERFLKKYYGKTFQQKKQEARMSAAKIYLTDKRLSITQIAEKLNYSTSQHFTQAFRQHYGITANKYRRQLQDPVD